MPQRHRPPYAPEFRRQMIEMVRAGRDPEQLAREFEPSAQAIRNWVAQADRDAGRRDDGLTTVEREELRRLSAAARKRGIPVNSAATASLKRIVPGCDVCGLGPRGRRRRQGREAAAGVRRRWAESSAGNG